MEGIFLLSWKVYEHITWESVITVKSWQKLVTSLWPMMNHINVASTHFTACHHNSQSQYTIYRVPFSGDITLCTFPQKMFSWKIDCSWNDRMFLICTRPINLNHTLLCFSATIFTTRVFQQKKGNFLIGVRKNENMPHFNFFQKSLNNWLENIS